MPKSKIDSRAARWLLSLLMLAAGVAITGVGIGLIPVEPEKVHAPYWVIALCGIMFLAGGTAVLLGEKNPLNRFLAATIALSLAISFAWVAFYGDGQHMSGGAWFLPKSANVALGRVVFGLGSLLGFVIGGLALFSKRQGND